MHYPSSLPVPAALSLPSAQQLQFSVSRPLVLDRSPVVLPNQSLSREQHTYESIAEKKKEIAKKQAEYTKTYEQSLGKVENEYMESTREILREIQVAQDGFYARNLDQPNANYSQEEMDIAKQELMSAIEKIYMDSKRNMKNVYDESMGLLKTELLECRNQQMHLDELEARRYSDELNNPAPWVRPVDSYQFDGKHYYD